MNEIFEKLEKIYPRMVEWRRDFHMYPELSFQEVNTPIKIAHLLRSFGLEVTEQVARRGVIGILKGALPGKTVALRADFDALPIQDEKDVPYKSKIAGVMHACGHDAHTSILLGIAAVLSQHKEEITGTIIFIHQFAEEVVPGGAIQMIEDGCLEGVDAIFGTHLWSGYPVGIVGYRSGYLMAAADCFEIEIAGKGGHGAMPHQTIDSIAIGAQFIQTLQQIVSRRIDPIQPAVISIGSFQAGNADNVIADKARLKGTLRSFDEAVRQQLEKELRQVLDSCCAAFGASYKLHFSKGYPAVHNHEEPTLLIKQVAEQVVGVENVLLIEPIMGAEDFAYYLQHVPGSFFFTGAANPDKGANHPHHHPLFDIDEEAMLIAAKTLTAAALSFLSKS